MPLVRFELKNEYGLGDPRLYHGAPKEEEDPRSILGGVTVTGLVGILRQLGDLAELAAVVFHDVHQQVMTTAARGHKVLNRIQKIEATLPQFEKAVQEQKSHIHFAYIAGCDWHTNIQTGQSQLFFSDLPEFMLDSYEECRDPPRLQLLDRFDSAGAGTCMKRYSDPSYFRMLMANSDSVMVEKANSGMKVQRKKKQRSRGMHGLARHSINMTLRGRSSMQFASLVADSKSVLVDDVSISDTLSISGFTTELTHFSSDKRSCCLEAQNSPSSMSKELYDGMPATDAQTTLKVDFIFDNHSKLTASDYVIQDSLHQQNDPFSSSISCDEKTEMVKSVSQMLSHNIPVDGLNPKAAELSCSLSNGTHSNDGLGALGEHISRSLTWDESATDSLGAWVKTVSCLSSSLSKENATGNPEIRDKSISSTYSVASDEKAEIIESANSKFPDGIIHYRPPDSDLLFVTLETSNRQSEMDDTEMHNQEDILFDIIKMTVPSTVGGQISEVTYQLDKHMDAANALDSEIQTKFEYHTGQEVILFSHLNYNEMECESNKSLVVTTPSIDGVDSAIAHEFFTSSKKFFSLQVISDHLKSSGPAESESRLLCYVENAASESVTYDNTMKNDSERINSAPCLGLIVSITQAVVTDGIPPEDSLSRDSSGDNSAITVSEKELLCEYRNKQEMESTADLNCLATESQCSTEEEITASKLVCPDSRTHVVSFSSASCNGVIISSTQADGVPPEESLSQDYFGGTSAKTASEKEVFCERQSIQETELTDDSNCQENEYKSSMEKVIAASKLDDSDSETHVASFSSAPCPGFFFSSTQAVVIDGIPPEESLSQDFFVDSSAKTASEKEVLCERQTKQGAESMTNSNCPGTEYQISMEKVIAASIFDGPNSETHVASCGSSDAYASPVLCGPIISNSVDNINSSTLSSDVTLSTSPIKVFSPRNNSKGPRGSVSAQLTNKSVILSSDVTAATTIVSQGFPVDSFRKSSINIWTNGGLLGLEPSKPPDISVPNAYGSDDIYDDRSAANSQPHMLGCGNESRKLFFEADNFNIISFPEQDNIMGKISDEQSDSMLSKQRPKGSIQASSFCKIDNAQNSYFSGAASEIDGLQGKGGGTISFEADIYTKNKPEATVSKQYNIGMSVGFSSLAHRFLLTSLQRKSPMTGIAPLSELMKNDVHKLHGAKSHSKDKERPKLAISSGPLHKLGNKEDSAHGFSEKLVSPIFDSSGHQSPPLEHMNVSFQPMNDSDVSKLNLEFFSCQQQGNMGNTLFSSFQLLTDSFQPLLDGVLESDDDTFCRSCPYSSDDLTLHSESDDDIWGEDEIDISYKIEATGSISNSIEFNAYNASGVSQVNDPANLKHGSDELSFNSGDIIDLPNVSFLEISQRQLQTCNPSMQQTDLMSRIPNELQPPSPFLPTTWRVIAPSFAYIKNTISGEVETDFSVDSLPTERFAFHQLKDQDHDS